jgi:hypothetical protein
VDSGVPKIAPGEWDEATGARYGRLDLLEVSVQARGRGEIRRVAQGIQRHQDGVEIVEDLAGKCDQLVETRIERADAYSRPRFDQNDVAVRDAALREGRAAIRCHVAPRHSAFRSRR